MAAEAETSDGLLERSDAIGLVRQQLVAAHLDERHVGTRPCKASRAAASRVGVGGVHAGAVSKVATPTRCDVNPVKLVLGFVPFILFTVLSGWVPVGWAAVVGLVAALSVVALTAGGGTKLLPVV